MIYGIPNRPSIFTKRTLLDYATKCIGGHNHLIGESLLTNHYNRMGTFPAKIQDLSN